MMATSILVALLYLFVGVAEGVVNCSNDEIFCLKTGQCIQKEHNCLPGQETAAKCQHDEVFCLQSGKCIKQDYSCNRDESDCKPDEIFCLQTDRCIPKETRCDLPVSFSKCHHDEVFCLSSHTCIKREAPCITKSQPIQDYICPQNTMKCLQTGLCIDRKHAECPEENMHSDKICSSHEIFCLRSRRCVLKDTQCSSSTQTKEMTCEKDEVFCLQTQECIRKASTCDKNHISQSNCREDEVFCLQTGQCIQRHSLCDSSIYGQGKKCSVGETFCLQRGKCVAKTDCMDEMRDSDLRQCPQGFIKCLQTDQCVRRDCSNVPVSEKTVKCLPDQTMCLKTGKCMNKTGVGDCNEERKNTSVLCTYGEIFCIRTGECIKDNSSCISTKVESTNETSQVCSHGKVFCLATGSCVEKTITCQNRTHQSSHHCGENEMFCLKSNRCVAVNSCNYTDLGSGNSTVKQQCKEHETLCLKSGRCVLKSDRCLDNNNTTTNESRCPEGLIFCLNTGKCISDTCMDLSNNTRDGNLTVDTTTVDLHSPNISDLHLISTTSGYDMIENATATTNDTLIDGRCHDGMTFCLQSGKCIDLAHSCERNSTDDLSCHEGLKFCLHTGKCVNASCIETTTYISNASLEISTADDSTLVVTNDMDLMSTTNVFDNLVENGTTDTHLNTTTIRKMTTEMPLLYREQVHVLLPEPLFKHENYHLNIAEVFKEHNITEATVNCTENILVKNHIGDNHAVSPMSIVTDVVLSIQSGSEARCAAYSESDAPDTYFVLHIIMIDTNIIPDVIFSEEMKEIKEDSKLVSFFDWSDWFNVSLTDNIVDTSMFNLSHDSAMSFNDLYKTKLLAMYKMTGINVELKLHHVPRNMYDIPMALLEVHDGSKWIPKVHHYSKVNIIKDLFRVKFIETCSSGCQITLELRIPGLHNRNDTMIFKVKDINDAPQLTPRAILRLNSIVESTFLYPYVHEEAEFKISDFINHLYTDDDGDNLGLAVIGQTSDMIGHWEYHDSTSWNPFPVINNQDIRQSHQASVILLGANNTIRFSPKNGSHLWTRHEAMSYTKLIVLGWDGSDLTSEMNDTVDLNICSGVHVKMCGPGKESHYSIEILPLYINRVGCDGVPSSQMSADSCGVCGGHDECIDCTGTANGGASYDMCGDCSGGASGIPFGNALDCNNECGINYYEGRLDMCIKNGTDVDGMLSLLSCDKVLHSGAIINNCGYCVLGATSLPADYGQDVCGMCNGHGTSCLDCNGTVHGTREFDMCGQCLDPNDSQFNTGCMKLGMVVPSHVHNFGHHALQIKGVRLELFNDVECMLSRNMDVTLNTTEFNSSTSIIHTTTPNLETLHGSYNITCTFDGTTQLYLENGLLVYPYPEITEISPNTMSIGDVIKVNITITNLLDIGYVKCVLLCPARNPNLGCYATGGISKMDIPTTLLDSNTVHCDLKRMALITQARAYNLSVIVEHQDHVHIDRLQSVEFIIRAEAPVLQGALFDKSFCFLSIMFDTEIAGPNHCAQLFHSRTIDKLGFDPFCITMGRRVYVKLGKSSTLLPEDSIEVMPSKIHRFGAQSVYANYATGRVNVTSAAHQISPTFTINGPTSVGSCDQFTLTLKQSDVGCMKFNYRWSVEMITDSNQTISQEFQQFKNKVASLQNNPRMLQVYHNEIPAGNSVEFTVTIDDQFNNQTHIVNHNVTRNVQLNPVSVSLVLLGNPLHVDPSSVVRLYAKATVAECYNSTEVTLRYSWQSGTSDFSLSIFNDKSVAAIRPNTLRGGFTYTVTINAFLEEDTNAATSETLTFHTLSKPLVVIIDGGESVVFSSNQEVILDASNSEDPDRTNLQPFFTWTCTSENGFPCFLQSGNETLLMANVYSTLDKVNIPSNTLIVGQRMLWTVTMTVGRRSGTYSTMVEIVNILPPSINLQVTKVVVNPDGQIRIPCTVSSNGPVMATWSSSSGNGYDSVDLEDLLHHDNIMMESPEAITNKDFSLFLDLSKDNVLPAGSKFVFVVSAFALDNEQTSEKHVEITINSAPTTGDITVHPTNGSSLVTEFTIDVGNGWTDNDGDSTMFYFYVKETDSEWMRLNARGLSDVYSFSFKLTEGIYDVMVQLCDIFGACSNVKVFRCIDVYEKTMTSAELEETVSSLTNMLKADVNQAIGMAMTFSSLLTTTDSTNASTAVSAVINHVATSMITSVVASYDPADATSVLDSANTMLQRLGDTGGLGSTAIAESQSLAFDLASFVTTSYDQSRRRRRRSSSVTVTPLSINDAEVILTTYSATFEPQQEDSITTSSATDFLQALDNVFIGVCATVSYVEDPVILKSSLVIANIDKRAVENTAPVSYDVSCDNCSQIQNPANVTYGLSIQSHFTQWNCSAYLSCYGACFVTAQLTKDLITPTSPSEMALTNRVRRSDIVVLKIANPVENTLINVHRLQSPMTLSLTVYGDVNTTAYSLQCLYWNSDSWSDMNCSSSEPTAVGSSYVVECFCYSMGYIALFEGPPNLVEETTTSTDSSSSAFSEETATTDQQDSTTVPPSTETTMSIPSFTSPVKVSFTIDADYSVVVGLYLMSFISSARQELATTMQIDVERIKDFTARSGSIVITFTVTEGASTDTSVEDAVRSLYRSIESETLVITDQNGTPLSIVKSSFSYQEVDDDNSNEDDGGSSTLYIILGCVGGLLVVAVIVIGILLHKMKKDNTAVSSSPPPPYGPNMHGVDVPRPASSGSKKLVVEEKKHNSRRKSRDELQGKGSNSTSKNMYSAGQGSSKKEVDIVAMEKGVSREGSNLSKGASGIGVSGQNWMETEKGRIHRVGSSKSIPGPAVYMPPISG